MVVHQTLHNLASRPCGVDRDELARALDIEPKRASSELANAAVRGLVYPAKASKRMTRYFTRAASAVVFLQAHDAVITGALRKAAQDERQAELDHAVRMGADPHVLVAQRRSFSRVQPGQPDRRIAPRPGQEDWRACPSLMNGVRIARQEGGAA